MCKFLKIIILLSVFSFFLFSNQSFAEEINQNATKAYREELQKKLNDIDKEIEAVASVIGQLETRTVDYKRDIDIVNAKIKKAKLEIQRLDMEIVKTKTGIEQRSDKLVDLLDKSEKRKDSLAELIRKNNEIDSTGLAEIVLGYQKMSDFFITEDSLEFVHYAIQDALDEIKQAKKQTEKERDNLEERQTEQVRLKMAQEKERKNLAINEAEKQKLLKRTEVEKKNYQAQKVLKQKDAAMIRSQLFLLSGSPSISFEKAMEYANLVWRTLSVRPAFLLAVIREESNLGANVGKGNWKEDLYNCYIKLGYKTSAEKQKTAFLEITASLGLDPDLLPVSKKQSYGCGGAMGPAQFMPVTWQGYKKRIANIGGNNPPNPWNPKDAFIAAGLLLSDNGADLGTFEAERKAALKYLAGSNWNKPSVRFYGDDVMEFASDYQEQIDIVNKLAER